jgi:copper chaperone NosL
MRKVPVLVGAVAVLAVAALVAALVLRGRPLPDQPVPVVWNREPCAHCRMLVGEPAFAAQLVTTGGEVKVFDDPGCLFHYVDAEQPHVHRIWFHDSTGDRWLTPEEVGFVPGARTPMNYGLAAVPSTTPGALALDAARARLP